MNEGDALPFIEELEGLPTLPTIASRVVSVTSGAGTSVKEVAELIEKDMGLSAKILQVTNSSFYSFSREIYSISEAVSLMGFKQVGNLALGLSVIESFPLDRIYGFDYREFWEQAVSNAVAAVMIAARLESNAPNAVFTSALLQDIGTYVLVRYLPVGYGHTTGVAQARNDHRVHAENEVLGTDHAEVGALLAQRWNLPRAMRAAIRHHHFSEFNAAPEVVAGQDETSTLVKVVSISNLISQVIHGEDGGAPQAALKDRARRLLYLESEQIDQLLEALPGEMESIKSLFQLTGTQQGGAVAEEDVYYDRCPKCGSTFSLKFCADCGAPLIRKRKTVEAVPEGRSPKILIAEDSQAIRTALVSLLRKRGYRTYIAVNGEGAVGIALREQPDLILMDIGMPVMDGIEALRAIRGDVRLQSTPVVMLTSVSDLDTVTLAIDSGANDYIAKPFKVEKLLDCIEKYVHALASHQRANGFSPS